MNLEQMKEEYEVARSDASMVQSRTAKDGIYYEIRKLKSLIEAEEHRQSSELKVKNINGIKYTVPHCFTWYEDNDKYSYEVKDGCLYRFEKLKYDNDGSFHLHHYVWIPQTDSKFVKLCVRTLGADRFGERYYLSASYFKHPADHYSYMSKNIYAGNYGYKQYYLYVFEKMGLRQKKDRWEVNLLEWTEQKNVDL